MWSEFLPGSVRRLESIRTHLVLGFGLLLVLALLIAVIGYWSLNNLQVEIGNTLEQADVIADLTQKIEQAEGVLILLAVVSLTLAILVAWILARRIIQPLDRLSRAAEEVGKGNLDARVSIRASDEFGNLAGAFNSMTARLQEMLTALSRSEEYFRSIIENASDIVVILAADGGIRYGSPAIERILGYKTEDLIDKSAWEFIHPDDRPNLVSVFKQRIQESGAASPVEVRFLHKEGSWRILEAVGNNLLDDPAVEGVVINARDITERKRVEDSIQRRNRELALLNRVIAAASTTLELKAVLEITCQDLAQALDVPLALATLLDESGESSTVVAEYVTKGRTGTLGAEIPVQGNPAMQYVLEHHAPLAMSNVQHDPRMAAIHDLMQQRGTVSLLVVPLLVRDDVVGIIGLNTLERREFSQEEISLATSAAAAAARALENARLFEAEREARQLSDTLSEMVRELNAAPDLDTALDLVLFYLERAVAFDSGSILMLEDNKMRVFAVRGFEEPERVLGLQLDLDVALLNKEVVESRQPLIVGSVADDPRWLTAVSFSGMESSLKHIQSWLGVPLLIQDRVIGMLTADKAEPNFYRPEDARLVLTFASHAAIAIEKARLLESERAQLRLAQTLQAVGALLTTGMNLDEVFEQIFDLLSQVVEYDSVSVQLFDRSDQLYLAAGRGFPDFELASQVVRTVAGQTTEDDWAQKRVIVIPDTHADGRWIVAPGLEYIRSWVGAALLVKGRLVGILNVDSATVNAYDEATGETVAAFANQAAVAIENARLYDQAQQEIAERKRVEGALRASEAKYRSLFESVLDGVFQVTPEGKFITVNPALARMLGYESERELLAVDSIADLYVDVQRRQEFTTRLEKEGELRNTELSLRHKDGGQVIALENARVVRDEGGRALYYEGTLTDITERKWAEAERERFLADLEHRSRLLQTAAEVSKSASTILNPEKLMEQAVGLIRERFDFYYVGLFLVDEPGEYAVLRAGTGEAGRRMLRADHRLAVGGESMIGWAVAHAQARIALDVGKEAVRFDNPDLPDTRSEMALPLISRGRCIGALTVQSVEEAAFSDDDIAVLQTMADQLAIAIENARLYEAAQGEIARRRQVEEELRKSEERYRALFDGTPDMYFIISSDNTVLSVNRFGAAYLGYLTHELAGRPISIVVHPEDRDYVHGQFASFRLEPGRVHTLEFRKVRKDGSQIWVEEFIRFQRSETNGDYHMLVLCRDITDRKQAEEEIRYLKDFNEGIVQSMAEGIMVQDAEGYFTFVNPAAANMLGYDPDELLGLHWTAVVPSDQRAVVRQADERRLQGQADRYEVQMLCRDGTSFPTLVSGSPRFEGERFVGTLAVFSDITERKRAEAERERFLADLEHRSRLLQTAAEVSKSASTILNPEKLMEQAVGLIRERFDFYYVGLFLVDEPGEYAVLRAGTGEAGRRMLRADHRLAVGGESMIGWAVAHAQARIALDVGKEAVRFDNPDLPDTRSEMALPLISRGRCIGALTVQSVDEAAFLEDDIAVLQTMADQLAVAVENARLYDEIRRLNESLERRVAERTAELAAVNKELQAFAYSVSHDLRAPLRSIDGFSQALLEDYGDRLQGDAQDYLSRVRAASQRMAQLIDDLLHLSRITRREMHRRRIDLSALAQTVADVLQQQEPERDVAFVIQENLVADGDARLLRIALENLMGNAWKFTAKHPTARIEFGAQRVPAEEDQVEEIAYFVRDDGAGFEMDYADKLFGVFQRLHSTSEFDGTGIGLATVQRIIHRHGGRIWAEGAVEEGATFYFTLGERIE